MNSINHAHIGTESIYVEILLYPLDTERVLCFFAFSLPSSLFLCYKLYLAMLLYCTALCIYWSDDGNTNFAAEILHRVLFEIATFLLEGKKATARQILHRALLDVGAFIFVIRNRHSNSCNENYKIYVERLSQKKECPLCCVMAYLVDKEQIFFKDMATQTSDKPEEERETIHTEPIQIPNKYWLAPMYIPDTQRMKKMQQDANTALLQGHMANTDSFRRMLDHV